MTYTEDRVAALAHFLKKYLEAGGQLDKLGQISLTTAQCIVREVELGDIRSSIPIPDINEAKGLSTQTVNLLIGFIGDVSVRELARCSEQDLRGINGFGQRRVTEVKKVLGQYGLRLHEPR